MTLVDRYKRLNLWNKVAFWGSVASIIGLAAIFLPVGKSESGTGISVGKASHSAVVQGTGNVVTVNNFSPGSTQINNPLPRPGLRLLETNTLPDGTNVLTVFKFGSRVNERLPTYSVDLEFSRPYDSVQTIFEATSPLDAHGGLDGQPYPPINTPKRFKVSGRDLGQTRLVLQFTAPYAMQISRQTLSPPPE